MVSWPLSPSPMTAFPVVGTTETKAMEDIFRIKETRMTGISPVGGGRVGLGVVAGKDGVPRRGRG